MTKLSDVTRLSESMGYYSKLDISHASTHLKTTINTNTGNNLIVNHTSIINKYYYIFLKYTYMVELSEEDYLIYRYNPKRFCYDRYGTTELWSLLLKINNIISVSEFNVRKLRVFDTDIDQVINEIMILESEEIQRNKAKTEI